MQEPNSRAAKVEFLQNIIPEIFSELKQVENVVMKRLGSIEPGGDLFVIYGSSYKSVGCAAIQELEARPDIRM